MLLPLHPLYNNAHLYENTSGNDSMTWEWCALICMICNSLCILYITVFDGFFFKLHKEFPGSPICLPEICNVFFVYIVYTFLDCL